jgi:hypothetical protein
MCEQTIVVYMECGHMTKREKIRCQNYLAVPKRKCETRAAHENRHPTCPACLGRPLPPGETVIAGVGEKLLKKGASIFKRSKNSPEKNNTIFTNQLRFPPAQAPSKVALQSREQFPGRNSDESNNLEPSRPARRAQQNDHVGLNEDHDLSSAEFGMRIYRSSSVGLSHPSQNQPEEDIGIDESYDRSSAGGIVETTSKCQFQPLELLGFCDRFREVYLELIGLHPLLQPESASSIRYESNPKPNSERRRFTDPIIEEDEKRAVGIVKDELPKRATTQVKRRAPSPIAKFIESNVRERSSSVITWSSDEMGLPHDAITKDNLVTEEIDNFGVREHQWEVGNVQGSVEEQQHKHQKSINQGMAWFEGENRRMLEGYARIQAEIEREKAMVGARSHY